MIANSKLFSFYKQ
jgi:signal transduction histidine kinase